MFTLNVRADVSGLQSKMNRIEKGLGDRAVVDTLNKTAAEVKTLMSKAIRVEYNISAKLVGERLKVAKARRSGLKFTATLIGNPAGRAKRAMNLIHFVERKVSLAEGRRRRKSGTQRGVYVKVKKAGGLKLVEGAFIANNGRTVFKRVGASRLPIVPANTGGVPQMFNTKKVQIPVQKQVGPIFARIFPGRVKYFLSTVK